MVEVGARADYFTWEADGRVLLRSDRHRKRPQLIPDAIATTDQLRLFIEVDRRSRSLRRVESNLAQYDDFLRAAYQRSFPDWKEPWVVYVVGSSERKKRVARVAEQRRVGGHRWAVLATGAEARSWLASKLLEEPADNSVRAGSPAKQTLASDAAEVLRTTHDLFSSEADLVGVLRARQPKLADAWRRSLWELHTHLRAEGAHGLR